VHSLPAALKMLPE